MQVFMFWGRQILLFLSFHLFWAARTLASSESFRWATGHLLICVLPQVRALRWEVGASLPRRREEPHHRQETGLCLRETGCVFIDPDGPDRICPHCCICVGTPSPWRLVGKKHKGRLATIQTDHQTPRCIQPSLPNFLKKNWIGRTSNQICLLLFPTTLNFY